MDNDTGDSNSQQLDKAVEDDDDVGTGDFHNTPAPSSAEFESQSGIDIRKALEILSSRTAHSHNHENHLSYCGGTNDKPPPAILKNMGQTIDLFAQSPAPSVDSAQPLSSSSSQERTANTSVDASEIDQIERRQKIRDTIRDTPLIALLKMVLTAQEDRVRTYRLYDEALGKVLISNRLTDYPAACVAATAAFSVLSDTIMAVRDELSARKKVTSHEKKDSPWSMLKSVIELINDLQSSEREKLQLTAAIHLEQIRVNNLKESNTVSDQSENNGNNGDVDRRELLLLNEGVDKLRCGIEKCRSDINGVIEDLRCTLLDTIEEG